MNLEEFVESSGTTPQPPPPPAPPAGPSAAEFQQMNSRLEALMEENRHNRELMTQFVSRQQQPAASVNDDDEELEVDGDVADDFATNGMEALRKRGVLTKKETRELIREEASAVARQAIAKNNQSLIKDAEMARDFPDLMDSKSELFKRTMTLFNEEIAEDPSLKNNPRTLNRAARLAKAELKAEGHYDERRSDGFGDSRQRRIDAQSGDRSSGQRGGDDDDSALSPSQRNILAKFAAAGEGTISEDDYKRHAKKISMGGIPKGGF